MIACSGKNSSEVNYIPDDTVKAVNLFSADTAFNYIEKQLSFGNRVPGTAGHEKCAEWIIGKMEEFTDTVTVQTGKMKAFDGTVLPIKNIMAQLNPDKKDRLLLLAHYDTRPWADAEKDKNKVNIPIPGANDGASGTAVLMELARTLKADGYKGGIDFLFVDAEDYGCPEGKEKGSETADSWCLGTQYWVSQLTPAERRNISFAILLDMVGGKNAVFHKEYFSKRYASAITDRVWKKAVDLGFGDRFPSVEGNPITDDHLYLLQAGIPTIDIIENNNPATGTFNPTWHTLNDSLENIDKTSLEAVGRTVQEVVLGS